MNNITLIGRLTKDPELKYVATETPVATFTLAIDRDYKNKDGSKITDFIPVEIMGKPAEYTANYILKGDLAGVIGSIRVDRYQTNTGENRSFTKVFANRINKLSYKGNTESNKNNDESNTEAPQTFSAIDDEDVPF